MKEFTRELCSAFEAHRDPVAATGEKKYLKNQFEFLGLGTSCRRQLQKEFFQQLDYPKPEEMKEFCLYLWQLPEREYQHAALDVLRKQAGKLRKQDVVWIEGLITDKSWWDTVDGLAVWIVGTYFKLYPEQILQVTEKWMASGNIWLQRTCLIFQMNYKGNTDTALLARYIEDLASHKDFFIRKAIGWILRQYSKTNGEWVRKFLETHEVSGLSRREASRYI